MASTFHLVGPALLNEIEFRRPSHSPPTLKSLNSSKSSIQMGCTTCNVRPSSNCNVKPWLLATYFSETLRNWTAAFCCSLRMLDFLCRIFDLACPSSERYKSPCWLIISAMYSTSSISLMHNVFWILSHSFNSTFPTAAGSWSQTPLYAGHWVVFGKRYSWQPTWSMDTA